jgi:hypothetical protein
VQRLITSYRIIQEKPSIYTLANGPCTAQLHSQTESYRTRGNIIEVRKHSKQRKIDVHDESRTIMHMYIQEITDDKGQ